VPDTQRDRQVDPIAFHPFFAGEAAMTDYPRFEPVRGEPDTAHEAYHGGSLVSLVFRLVDRWRGRTQRASQGRATPRTEGAIEVHERLPVPAPTAALMGSGEIGAPGRALYQVGPDEHFSQSFLIGSARTQKLQTGLLAAFLVVLVMLVAQGLRVPGQVSHRAVVAASGPHERPRIDPQSGHSALLVARELPGQALP
jgi:hypothetical protein